MSEETLEYLEKVLSGLKARFASGDKSVELRIRAVSAKIDQLKLKKDLEKPKPLKNVSDLIARTVRRRSCCR